jgi:hypothetical protein
MKSLAKLLALTISAAAVLTASLPASGATPPGQDARYALVCSSGAHFQAILNDVLVAHSDGKEEAPPQVTINFWLRSGKNTLRLLVPEGATTNPGKPAYCKILVSQFSDAGTPHGKKAGRILTSVALPAGGATGRTPPDKTVSFSLTAKAAPACKLWEAAKPITLDSQAKEEILGLVGEYRTALQAQNLERMVALDEFRSKESYLCTGRSIEEYQASGKEITRILLAALGGAKFAPWDPSQARIQLEAGGLVASVTVNGQPPITATRKEGGPNAQYTSNAYIAKIGDKWTLVR